MKLDTLIPKPSPSFSNEQLEQMRRSVPLKIDSFGHWWHDEERFKHPRLIHAFNQGLGWTVTLPPRTTYSIQEGIEWYTQWIQGEGKVTIHDRWCYLECDQTPFIGLAWKEEETLSIVNNQSQTWEVALFFERNDVLFVIGQNAQESILIRLDRLIQAQCIDWLEEAGSYREHSQLSPYEIHYQNKIYPIISLSL